MADVRLFVFEATQCSVILCSSTYGGFCITLNVCLTDHFQFLHNILINIYICRKLLWNFERLNFISNFHCIRLFQGLVVAFEIGNILYIKYK